jgi:hypothetical protein
MGNSIDIIVDGSTRKIRLYKRGVGWYVDTDHLRELLGDDLVKDPALAAVQFLDANKGEAVAIADVLASSTRPHAKEIAGKLRTFLKAY